MPELASIAFDDPSWRSNPRMPLMSELVELFWKAYEGRGRGEVGWYLPSPQRCREGRSIWQ